MEVLRMFLAPCYGRHYVIKTTAGEFMAFCDTPARHIKADDLFPVPYYPDTGANAEEAPAYLYQIYGLEAAK